MNVKTIYVQGGKRSHRQIDDNSSPGLKTGQFQMQRTEIGANYAETTTAIQKTSPRADYKWQ